YGNKEALYEAVLLDAYREIRQGERELRLSRHPPVEAMDRLVRFTFRHFLANPWFPRLLAVENLQSAKSLKRIREIAAITSTLLKPLARTAAIHPPLVAELRYLLRRGHAAGALRGDLDPLQLYMSSAGLGYFSVSNMQTLSVIFDRDLGELTMLQEREALAVE